MKNITFPALHQGDLAGAIVLASALSNAAATKQAATQDISGVWQADVP